jgi:hypothetical protein
MVQSDRLTRLRAARDALSKHPVSPRRDALLREIGRRIVVTETGDFHSGGWSRSPDGLETLTDVTTRMNDINSPATFGL